VEVCLIWIEPSGRRVELGGFGRLGKLYASVVPTISEAQATAVLSSTLALMLATYGGPWARQLWAVLRTKRRLKAQVAGVKATLKTALRYRVLANAFPGRRLRRQSLSLLLLQLCLEDWRAVMRDPAIRGDAVMAVMGLASILGLTKTLLQVLTDKVARNPGAAALLSSLRAGLGLAVGATNAQIVGAFERGLPAPAAPSQALQDLADKIGVLFGGMSSEPLAATIAALAAFGRHGPPPPQGTADRWLRRLFLAYLADPRMLNAGSITASTLEALAEEEGLISLECFYLLARVELREGVLVRHDERAAVDRVVALITSIPGAYSRLQELAAELVLDVKLDSAEAFIEGLAWDMFHGKKGVPRFLPLRRILGKAAFRSFLEPADPVHAVELARLIVTAYPTTGRRRDRFQLGVPEDVLSERERRSMDELSPVKGVFCWIATSLSARFTVVTAMGRSTRLPKEG